MHTHSLFFLSETLFGMLTTREGFEKLGEIEKKEIQSLKEELEICITENKTTTTTHFFSSH